MNQPPHFARGVREPAAAGPGRSAWKPRWTLANLMTLVAVLACLFWSARELRHGNFIAAFLVTEVLWLVFLVRLIRGRTRDGRLF